MPKGVRKATTDTDREAGRLFRSARERAGLSQDEAAVRTGYHRDSIAKIERGDQWPPYASLQRLAAAYGIQPGDFFPNTGAGPELELVSPILAAMRGLGERQQFELIAGLAGQIRMQRAWVRGADHAVTESFESNGRDNHLSVTPLNKPPTTTTELPTGSGFLLDPPRQESTDAETRSPDLRNVQNSQKPVGRRGKQ